MQPISSTSPFFFTLLLSLIAGATANPPTATLSTTKTSKTIFIGRTLPEFNQDLFLGIKYANKPARFTPSELKTTYTSNDSNSGPYNLAIAGTSTNAKAVYYNATQYGYDCPAYGSDTTNLVNQGFVSLNEDCHNLNIVKPHSATDELLPVVIWIFGGGWSQGATADPRYVYYIFEYIMCLTLCSTRYNMSYLVQQSDLNDKPVLGVSINYRLSAFGFLDSDEVRVR
jgi:triacylglycerol lipase